MSKTTFAKFTITPETRNFVLDVARSASQYKPQVNKAIQTVAENCARDVKEVIKQQAFPNVRLSAAWLARKEKAGLDTRTLMATKKYYESIQAVRLEDGVWGVTCSDLELQRRLEEGTRRGNPARPHWAPVLDKYSRNFTDLFAAVFMDAVFGTVKP